MNDMSQTIIAKSDQLNADDLIGRDLTVTITKVDIKGGQEQPVTIHYENENGRPFRPCKSMCRCLVHVWGADANQYVGRSMTLYRDPAVKYGGLEVGGIRISRMSHIEKKVVMALTVTKANKKPYQVLPLERSAAKAEPEAPIVTPDTLYQKAVKATDWLLKLPHTAEALAKAETRTRPLLAELDDAEMVTEREAILKILSEIRVASQEDWA